MTFYHGSRITELDVLLPASQTGNIRSGEEMRRGFKDVIFLTTSWNQALEYAGPEGSVYAVETNAEKYKVIAAEVLNSKKLKSVCDKVYVADGPIRIRAEYRVDSARRTGEPHRFYVRIPNL